MNIYIVGDLRGAYRAEQLVKIIVEKKDYHLYVNDLKTKGTAKKICGKVSDFLALILTDVVYVAPCKHNSIWVKIAVFFRKKIITDYYISFYDTEVFDRKNCRKGSARARKWKNVDTYALKHSDTIIFLNKHEGMYYTNLLGMNLNKINFTSIPLCVPEKPKADLPYFTQNRPYIHFCWCGTYIPLQALDKIIRASAIALKSGLKMHLTIWGDDEKKSEKYQYLVNELRIGKSVTFVNNKWGDMSAWKEFISSQCDVTFGIFGDSNKAKTVLANKIVDGIAFQTPVLTAESLGLREFFTDYDLFIIDNTEDKIAEAMFRIAKMNYEDVKAMVDSAYEKYLINFTPAVFEEKICKCIERSMKEK